MKVLHSKSLFLFTLFFAVSNCEQYFSADTRKISYQIASGRGLYSEYDKIALLNSSNFKNEVYSNSSTKSWIIEFYSSWCGHCQRFSPIWKTLAQDTYGWRNLIRVGAVDCSNPFNTPLCRDYEVMTYPNLRYFPSGSSQEFLGIVLPEREVTTLRHYIIKQLRNESERRSDLFDVFVEHEGATEELWKKNGDFLVVVVENSSLFLKSELSLDFNQAENIKVFGVSLDKENIRASSLNDEGVYLLDKSCKEIDKIALTNESHLDIYEKIRQRLSKKKIVLPFLENKKITTVPVSTDVIVELIRVDQLVKQKLHKNQISDTVFQQDIEGALRQTLFVEIPSHKEIKSVKLEALKLYLRTLAELFPIGENGKAFLRCLSDVTHSKTSIMGSDFISEVKECERKNAPVYMSTGGWIGCRGSEPHFRGYPCSLWTMFHSLVAHSYLNPPEDPKQPLRAMKGYITHFFGCSDCSQHFQAMAETMEGNVTDTDSSILWLWKAHNSVNKRLHLDATEDPKHLKVQFPPPEICPDCHIGEVWKEENVLHFLKNMYTNISYLSLSDLPSATDVPAVAAKLIRQEVIIDKTADTKFEKNEIHPNWDLNLIDLFLVTLLYLTSVIIIGLICIKLCKKYQRKKLNVNSWDMADIFQKV